MFIKYLIWFELDNFYRESSSKSQYLTQLDRFDYSPSIYLSVDGKGMFVTVSAFLVTMMIYFEVNLIYENAN